MLYAALAILIVAAAAALGGLARRRPAWLPVLHTLAVTSALTVVLVGLVPDAAEGLGPWFISGVMAGFWAPRLLERFIHSPALDASGTMLALAAHQLIDGAQVTWLGAERGAGVAAVIALHGAAMTGAAVMLAGRSGPRLARLVGGVLVAATALGSAIGLGLSGAAWGDSVHWMQAIVAGVLLHTLLNEVGEHLPRTARARTLDLLVATTSAVAVTWMILGEHTHTGSPASLFLHNSRYFAGWMGLLMLAATGLLAAMPPTPDGPPRGAIVRGFLTASTDGAPFATAICLALGALFTADGAVLPDLGPDRTLGAALTIGQGTLLAMILAGVAQRTVRGWLAPLAPHEHGQTGPLPQTPRRPR